MAGRQPDTATLLRPVTSSPLFSLNISLDEISIPSHKLSFDHLPAPANLEESQTKPWCSYIRRWANNRHHLMAVDNKSKVGFYDLKKRVPPGSGVDLRILTCSETNHRSCHDRGR